MRDIILYFLLIVSFSPFIFCAQSSTQQVYVANTTCNTNHLSAQDLFFNNQWYCGREQWLADIWALGSAPYYLNVSDFWSSATCPNCIGNYGTLVTLLSGINQTFVTVLKKTMQTMYSIAPMWCQHGDQFCENVTAVNSTYPVLHANLTSYPVCTRIWCYYNPGTYCRPVDDTYNRNPIPNTIASCLTAGEFIDTHQTGCPIWNCTNAKKRTLLNMLIQKKKRGARKWLSKRALSESQELCGTTLNCGNCPTNSNQNCYDNQYTTNTMCCTCLSYTSQNSWSI